MVLIPILFTMILHRSGSEYSLTANELANHTGVHHGTNATPSDIETGFGGGVHIVDQRPEIIMSLFFRPPKSGK